MQPSQIEFFGHILDECNYLLRELETNNYDEFLSNERLIRAVCRSLEIIGEASSKILPDTKAKYPFINWRDITDLRNRIIHHYFGIDYDIVWDTLQIDIPELKGWIEIMILKEK